MPEIKVAGTGCGCALPLPLLMAVIDGFGNMEAPSVPLQPQPPSRANATFIRAIHGYQEHGRKYAVCRFEPSCSEYGEQAFERYSFVRASLKTVWRIVRCNRWNTGSAYDPV